MRFIFIEVYSNKYDYDNVTIPLLSSQIIVWGDYGRMDHKSFLGAVQILLDELDLSNMVIGWFKLFPPSSLVDPTLAPLTRRASQSSLDSFSRS